MYPIASAGTIVFNRREKKSKQSQKIRDNGQVSLLAPKNSFLNQYFPVMVDVVLQEIQCRSIRDFSTNCLRKVPECNAAIGHIIVAFSLELRGATRCFDLIY